MEKNSKWKKNKIKVCDNKMIVLVTSGMKAHTKRVNETDMYGDLVTPRCRASITRTNGVIGVDNDRFNDNSYSDIEFMKLLIYLSKFKGKDRIKFVSAPDIPFNALGTFRDFYKWHTVIKEIFKLPIALVTQDGMTTKSIDWDRLDAVFIGGTTEYKMSHESIKIIKKAQDLKKWVHVGRVNTAPRFTFFKMLNVDSIDGSSFSMFQEAQIKLYENTMKQETLNLQLHS